MSPPNQNGQIPGVRVIGNNQARSAVAMLQGKPVSADRSLGAGPPFAAVPPLVQHEPGGDVITSQLKHPSFVTVDRLFRTLPEDAFFEPTLSPSKPFIFELGSFVVPAGMQFWMTDYRFSVLRFSGLDAGDFLEAAPTRFSSSLGFDVTIAATIRQANLNYEIDPTPVATKRSQFAPRIPGRNSPGRFEVPNSVFDSAAAKSFASTAGPGNSLLPVRDQLQGPRGGPFTFIVEEGQTVALVCAVLRPLTSPIAAIQGSLAGFTIHTNMGKTLISRIRPQ